MTNEIEKAEYDSLRTEIAGTLKEIRSLERYVAAATGAVWAWLVTQGQASMRAAWFIPFFFAVYGAWRSWALWHGIEIIARYLRRREHAVKQRDSTLDRDFGWETYREPENAGVMSAAAWFWGTLLVLTLSVGFFGCSGCFPPKHA